MIGWVLFEDKTLSFRFQMSNAGSLEKGEYPLGGSLCDFTAITPKISEKLFQVLGQKFERDIASRIDIPTIGAYVPFLRKALETNPYLFVYLKFYADCLIQSRTEPEQISGNLHCFLSPDIAEKYLGDIPPLRLPAEAVEWLGTVIGEDLEYRRTRTKQQLESIVAPDASQERYTKAQRYYLLCNESKSGLKRSFTMRAACTYDFSPSANLGTLKATLADSDIAVFPEFEIKSPDDFIALEMYYSIAHRLPMKICKCCAELFVPLGRSDSEYCSRISMGEEKRCTEIGAMRTYKEKHGENPVFAEYNKAYKRNHSRLRNGKLYDHEFKTWSAAARAARDEYAAAGRSAEAFAERLAALEKEMEI